MIDTPLRILVVLPLYGGSLPIGRYCASALKSLGHRAEVFESPDFHAGFKALSGQGMSGQRLLHLENSYLQVVSQAVVAKAETFEPDLVLAMAQAPLSRQSLKRLRQLGIPTAMWFVEDHRLFTYWQAYAQYYDLFAVIQREPFLTALAGAGQPNGLYLPLAADPDFHKPVALTPAERAEWGSAVSFMGAGYPNRRVAFRRLVGHDFKIWGSDWDGDALLAPLVQKGGRRVSPEECVKIFCATDVNLNLHSSVDPNLLVSGGDFVNPRTFELAACGAFQLVDERQLLGESFGADEIATFADMDDLLAKLEYYRSRPQERAAMAAKARARVLKDHTYAARMQSLLDFAAQRLPGWPKTQNAARALDALPADLRPQVAELLQELGLTPQTSFADLVQAVRSRQGVLSELDTAILFLDEWRKQYAPGL